jgi:S1/P1 Nuclease
VLSSSSASEQERLEALKYLGHWDGDVHQPLHLSFQDDRGGN